MDPIWPQQLLLGLQSSPFDDRQEAPSVRYSGSNILDVLPLLGEHARAWPLPCTLTVLLCVSVGSVQTKGRNRD